MSYERLENLGGIQWPCPTEDDPGALFLHGRLWDRPVTGPRAPFHAVEYSAPVDVEGLELKDLFDLADIEDVSGEGPMSGSVPIRIQGDDIVIEDGHLESTGPGVFRIRSAEAKAALQGAGDYVDLVLQALENFQYERLSIDLNKPADGNSVLQLKVLGSNPEVLDGHPFDINLNLETDLAPLLDALGAGQRLSEELMERIRKSRQGSNDSQE